MGHGQGHHHQDHGSAGEGIGRALRWAFGLNAVFLVVEVAAGWITGSLALLSDAAHMVSDVAALALALGASWFAKRAATAERSFGWRRAETLAAFTNALGLLVIVGVILREAVERLSSGAPSIAAAPVLIVGVVGLLINLGSAWFLARSDRNNLNVRGALTHMLADALGSVGAMVAALGLWLGLPAADAAVSVLVALLVLVGSWRLLRDSARRLLQFAPASTPPASIRSGLLEIDGVCDLHDLHIWALDDDQVILTAHLVVGTDTSISEVRQRAERFLEETFDITHTTLQMEMTDCCEPQRCPFEAT